MMISPGFLLASAVMKSREVVMGVLSIEVMVLLMASPALRAGLSCMKSVMRTPWWVRKCVSQSVFPESERV